MNDVEVTPAPGSAKYGPPLVRDRLTVNVDPVDDDCHAIVTRRLPPLAVTADGMAGAVVGVSVPPPPTPQAGTRIATRRMAPILSLENFMGSGIFSEARPGVNNS